MIITQRSGLQIHFCEPRGGYSEDRIAFHPFGKTHFGLIGRHLADPQSLCALILCEEGKFISRFFQAVHHKIGGGVGYKRVNPARKNLFEQCMNGRTVGAAGSRLLHHPATLFHSP